MEERQIGEGKGREGWWTHACFKIVYTIAYEFLVHKILSKLWILRMHIVHRTCKMLLHYLVKHRILKHMVQTLKKQLANDDHWLRGHRLRLYVNRNRLNCRKYSLSRISVTEWNKLWNSRQRLLKFNSHHLQEPPRQTLEWCGLHQSTNQQVTIK